MTLINRKAFDDVTTWINNIVPGWEFREVKWSDREIVRRWTGLGEHIEVVYKDDR